MYRRLLAILLLAAACGSNDDETSAPGEGEGEGEDPAEGEGEGEQPDLCIPEVELDDPSVCERQRSCPGGPDCATGEGELSAGFSKVDITPGFELPAPGTMDDGHWTGLRWDAETFLDCGRDQLCPEDAGYEAPDADGSEGDGVFQAAWIAGFSTDRPAEAVHDPVWARCAVFSAGDTRVALVSFDLVGVFRSELVRMRERLDPALGIDLLVFSSTHGHEGPDTMGQWGPGDGGPIPGHTGRDDVMQEGMRAGAIRCVEEAVAGLRPAETFVGMVRTGVDGLNGDTRDPIIIDDELPVMRVVDKDNGEVLGTIVNWGSHPEALSGGNTQISSDFVHYTREAIENGLEPLGDHPGVEGAGGVCVYFSGAVGGLITQLRITAKGRDGSEVREASFEKAQALGERLAVSALDALGRAELDPEPAISFATRTFLLPVRNAMFQVIIFAKYEPPIFDRSVFDFDRNDPGDDPPMVRTEVSIIRIGKATFFTVPGEVFPEAVVGFDEEWSHGLERVDPGNENPPDLAAAPTEAPLKRIMPGEVVFLLGLGNDELGYMVPTYDYKLGMPPYWDEADGDHYEETNSIDADFMPVVDAQLRALAATFE